MRLTFVNISYLPDSLPCFRENVASGLRSLVGAKEENTARGVTQFSAVNTRRENADWRARDLPIIAL